MNASGKASVSNEKPSLMTYDCSPEILVAAVSAADIVDRQADYQTVRNWAILMIVATTLIWSSALLTDFPTAIGFQMAFGLLLAVIGLFSPGLGILAIGMLSALDALAADLLLTGGLFRFNTLNYWLLLVMALYLPFLLRLRDLSTRTLQLFLILLGLELAFSQSLTNGVQDVLNITTTFGIIIYFARGLKNDHALYWLGIVNGVFAGFGGMIFFYLLDRTPYTNPNNWTYFQLTALFSICISFTYARNLKKNRLVLILLAAINFSWIFLSGSRGSLLIAGICAVYLFLSTRSITLSSVMVAAAVLIGIWITTQYAAQQSYTISRIQLLFDPTRTQAERTSQRSRLAQAGWEIFKDNPFGVGTGSFREVVSSPRYLSGNQPAHSAWIKTLAENGIPGILFLSLFIGSFIIAGIRKHEEGLILFGVFIAAVFAIAFIAKEFRGKPLWFLAASGITLMNKENIYTFLQKKLKPTDVDYRTKLREVRYGLSRK